MAEYFGRGLFAAPPNFGGSVAGDVGGNGSNSMSAKSANIRQMQPGKILESSHIHREEIQSWEGKNRRKGHGAKNEYFWYVLHALIYHVFSIMKI